MTYGFKRAASFIMHLHRVLIIMSLQIFHQNYAKINTSPDEGEGWIATQIDFNMICQMFNISSTECSCDAIPELCEVKKVFTNPNTSSPLYKRSTDVALSYATVTLFISLLSVLGNVAVLVTAYQSRGKMASCKVHIVELAVVNLLFSIVQIINTVPLYWTNAWIYGLMMCKMVRVSLEVGSFLEIGLVQIIAIERFNHVMQPLKTFTRDDRFKHLPIIINVVIALITIVPYFMALGIEDHTGQVLF